MDRSEGFTLARFFSGFPDALMGEQPQHSMLRLLLIFTIAIEMVFMLINFLFDHHLVALAQLFSAILLLPYLVRALQYRWISHTREFLLTNAFVIFLLLIVDGGIGHTGIYWAQLFPFLAFLLCGVRIGWRWNLAFLICYAAILTLNFSGNIDLGYSADTLHFAPSMFLVFLIIALLFELNQERKQCELLAINRTLCRREDELKKLHASLEETVEQRTRQLRLVNAQLSREMDEKIAAMQQHELAEMKYQQASKMESLGTLVGGIAHDFNNVLAGITANLYLLRERVDSPGLKKRIDVSSELLMRGAGMIRQMMAFSRNDTLQMERIDLSFKLQEMFELARLSIPEHIDCDLTIGEQSLAVRGDLTRLQQIMMNLINNVRDAIMHRDHPFISVTLSSTTLRAPLYALMQEIPAGEYVIISVEDNGCGIERDQMQRIFEPFYTTKEEGQGTGLGLSMVYGTIKSHGGYLDAVSYPGSGTRMSIYLPRDDADEAVKHTRDEVIKGHGEMLLLADDDPTLLKSISKLLSALGYRVITARNGMEAVTAYEQHRDQVALVLMDLVMPVLGGMEAARMMRQLNPDLKVLFLSGYDRDNRATSELCDNWEEVLNKPLSVEQLSAAIDRKLNDA